MHSFILWWPPTRHQPHFIPAGQVVGHHIAADPYLYKMFPVPGLGLGKMKTNLTAALNPPESGSIQIQLVSVRHQLG